MANKEKIRRSLVEEEFIAPNDWDSLEDDFSEMEETLENFQVYGVGDDDGEVYFRLAPDPAQTGMLTDIKWPFDSSSELSSINTLQRVFGGTPVRFGTERILQLDGKKSRSDEFVQQRRRRVLV